MTDSASAIARALADFKNGKFVVVMDDEDRENEGDLIIAAQDLTEAQAAFMVRHTSGMICVSVDPAILHALALPLMVQNNTDSMRTAYTLTTDYKHNTTTGISAHDRALTIRKLVDPLSSKDDFNRPGHVFPLRPHVNGTLGRNGHTEAGYDLARLTGKKLGAALSEIVLDNGKMARRPDLIHFAKVHQLSFITINDIIKYRNDHPDLLN